MNPSGCLRCGSSLVTSYTHDRNGWGYHDGWILCQSCGYHWKDGETVFKISRVLPRRTIIQVLGARIHFLARVRGSGNADQTCRLLLGGGFTRLARKGVKHIYTTPDKWSTIVLCGYTSKDLMRIAARMRRAEEVSASVA